MHRVWFWVKIIKDFQAALEREKARSALKGKLLADFKCPGCCPGRLHASARRMVQTGRADEEGREDYAEAA